jgi:CDP-glycerol glycerophosphotransferase (TagB/SpsB family)
MQLQSQALSETELASLPPTLFFHARAQLALGMEQRRFKLLTALADHALAQGWQLRLQRILPGAHEIAATAPQHLHVFMEDRGFYAPNIFHSTPGYLRGFWFFDEIGNRNNSKQRFAQFNPRGVPKHRAEAFFAELSSKVIAQNSSKFTQPAPDDHAIEPGSLAFFAQDFATPKHHRHFMSVPAMIEATIAAKGARRLYIKPHPNQSFQELETLAAYDDPAKGVHLVVASIHDLLRACDVVLTLSSAVGFEAFLHRKPVILGGETDFWQNALTLTDPNRMAAAIEAALSRDWPFEAFLYWYLQGYCVQDRAAALPRVLAALHRRGYALGDCEARGFF